jgi:hypothetical protein
MVADRFIVVYLCSIPVTLSKMPAQQKITIDALLMLILGHGYNHVVSIFAYKGSQ